MIGLNLRKCITIKDMTEKEQLFRRVSAQLEHWENVECFKHPIDIQIAEANRFAADRREAALMWAKEMLEGRWIPIATAPKDGTRVDLWMGSRFTNCYWGKPAHECGESGDYCDSCPTRDGWCCEDDPMPGYLCGPGGLYKGCSPTHWMHVPAGPSTD